MSLFSAILDKLGFGHKEADSDVASTATPPDAAPAPAPSPAETIQPISQVDVVAKLEAMAAANPERLNWKESIVDLMKLLDLDSSLSARKTLATELGCPPEKMDDSAAMNIWLHKTVMQRLAENGGNIPGELL